VVSAGFFLVPFLVLVATCVLATCLEGPPVGRARLARLGLALLLAAGALAAGSVLLARHQHGPASPATTPASPTA
jgi:hypothetical protein